MNLYEMNEEFKELMYKATLQAEENEGEIDFDLGEELEKLSIDIKQKKIACILTIKNKKADLKKFKDEEKKLKKRRESIENSIENIKNWLTINMCDGEKISDPRFKQWWKPTTAIRILDESKIDSKYVKIKETVSIDKKAIKSDIEANIKVEGAEQITNNNLIIG